MRSGEGVKTRECFSFQATFGGHPACPEANRMDQQVHLEYRGLRLSSWGWLGLEGRIPEAGELVSKGAPVIFQGAEATVHPAPGG